MSSILKALQKLEQEKTSRRQEAPDVAGDIVKPARARQRSPWLLPAAMAGVTVVAVLVTYAAMGGFSRPRPATVTAVAPTVTLPEKALVSTPPPVSSMTAAKPASPPQPGDKKDRGTRKIQTSTNTIAQQPAPIPPQQTISQPHSSVQTSPPVQAKPEPVPTAAPSLPTLRVTGIAWDKESASRLAMVNGTAVAQGGTVEGARVEEIFPDRVRFVVGKRSIEVPLGKSSADR